MQKINKPILLLPIVFFLILGGLFVPSQKPVLQLSKQESATNVSAPLYQYLSLGQTRLLTDMLWIQTLIESDEEHYKKKDLNSWMYHRFNTISILDPKFIENYWFGGQYLSVIKDDDLGAEKIYLKGLQYYPNDKFLNFYMAIHYMHELLDNQKALIYFQRLVDTQQAPYYIPSLIARIKAESGGLEESFLLIKDLYEKAPDNSSLKEKYFNSLYAIKAELDLDCLNQGKENCSRNDLEGNSYLQKNGKFEARRSWRKFRVYKRKPGDG